MPLVISDRFSDPFLDERRWASDVSLNQIVEIKKNEQSYGLTPLPIDNILECG
ncbi:MAG TPA: hypothetical protein VGJ73_19440 [Verrucomicrobiae bacterium]